MLHLQCIHVPVQSLVIVTALYDCDPDHPDELGFKEGEKLVVTRKMSKDWWVSAALMWNLLGLLSVAVIFAERLLVE